MCKTIDCASEAACPAEMPTVLEEASSVLPPVTTAQEVREASSSPQDAHIINQVRVPFKMLPTWLDVSCSISHSLLVQHHFLPYILRGGMRSRQ